MWPNDERRSDPRHDFSAWFPVGQCARALARSEFGVPRRFVKVGMGRISGLVLASGWSAAKNAFRDLGALSAQIRRVGGSR